MKARTRFDSTSSRPGGTRRPRRAAAFAGVFAVAILGVAAGGCTAGAGGAGADDETATAAPATGSAAPTPGPDTPVSSPADGATAGGVAPAAGSGDGGGDTGTAGGRAYVESVDVMVLESFPLQVRVGVAGQLSDACTHLAEPQVRREGQTFHLALPTTREQGMCAQMLVPFETTVSLDVEGLPKGTYTVEVDGKTGSFTFDRDNRLGEP